MAWANTSLCMPARGGSMIKRSGLKVMSDNFSLISPHIKRQFSSPFSLAFLTASDVALLLISMPVTARTLLAKKTGMVPVPLYRSSTVSEPSSSE